MFFFLMKLRPPRSTRTDTLVPSTTLFRSLAPAGMHDDGVKTYIDWSPETPLPAVFFIDDYGRERLANGNMRGGLYVIDSVHEELLFRIDKKKARAKRYLPKDEGS